MTQKTQPYKPRHPVRIVTSAALFDGHDASINIMRRILQATGAEVIHLGHNRSVEEVVTAAIQEDAQGVAVTSYQGGHMEFFTYMREMLDERGAGHVKIFGGGGGVIVPREIDELHERGIDRIFSPEDGRRLGLQGMINAVVEGCDYDPLSTELRAERLNGHYLGLARAITAAELNGAAADSGQELPEPLAKLLESARAGAAERTVPVVGLTGTGGAGKSSLTDELVRRFVQDFEDKRVAIVCVDPTRRRTGGALLGDRIRFNSIKSDRVYLRSLATRGHRGELSEDVGEVLELLKGADFDLIFLETAGIGQGDAAVAELADLSLYVMTAEYGAPTQLEKIEMLDHADMVVINKFTRRGSEDALRDVRKQVQRNRGLFDAPVEELPVFGTSAAHFDDSGVNALYGHLMAAASERFDLGWESRYPAGPERVTDTSQHVIPVGRERYLAEIAEASRGYRAWAREQADAAEDLDALRRSIRLLGGAVPTDWRAFEPAEIETAQSGRAGTTDLMEAFNENLPRLDDRVLATIRGWAEWEAEYKGDVFRYRVRDRTIEVENHRTTLSETRVPKVMHPRYRDWGDRVYWRLTENVPGEYPFTSGVFPFKRTQEDPTRMFAGEGPASRTNRRFHLLADGQPAKRLSTAFDSITLYGEDPHHRPDIYGKIGESGVSVFTVEEAEQLYAGFDLCDPTTSVSMTINGPAPTILAFFFNTAIRQQIRRFLRREGRLDITEDQELQPDTLRGATWNEVRALLTDEEYEEIEARTLSTVRGTVQADILKEDQGQNTCIFSTEFALRLMGDVQQFFID
ncbi:MAG TPA: methylmalonyl-CoA mutase family protein, partial [Thermoanaerobaculia bacterium]